jgi:hypothetical protein
MEFLHSFRTFSLEGHQRGDSTRLELTAVATEQFGAGYRRTLENP